MLYWLTMFSNIIIPVIMIVSGITFFLIPPKKINSFYGYRTRRSMQNNETWEFAHKFSGKIMFIVGILLLIVSIIVTNELYDENTLNFGGNEIFILIFQLPILILSIIPTEIALEIKFKNLNK